MIKCFKSQTKTTEQFIIDAVAIHGNLYGYSESVYVNCHTKVKIYCKKCKKYFWQTPNNHLNDEGCKRCKTSNGEKRIMKWLKENDIEYEIEKTFEGCKYKNLLRFDVYIPELKLCVEYDGEQHFKMVNFRGGMTKEQMENNLKQTQINDNTKNKYCQNNNINLLRIHYKDKKNINQILEKELKPLLANKLSNTLKLISLKETY